jgi:TM2 domain-containing membrane protein YozV
MSTKESARDVMTSEKSRLAAGLLGIFLGAWGIHRFYLGNIGIGIIQIIVTLITCGIGGLWGFIEGIIIIAGGNWRDAKGMPLKKLSET